MLLSIRSSKEVWKSGDGKITIWEVVDGDNAVWQTMSGKIANSIGQTIEVTTRTNPKGKTYLITPPQDAPGPLAQSAPAPTDQAMARFEAAVAAFSDAVDRLTKAPSVTPQIDIDALPLEDPSNLNDPLGADFDRAIAALNGDKTIDDDLR